MKPILNAVYLADKQEIAIKKIFDFINLIELYDVDTIS